MTKEEFLKEIYKSLGRIELLLQTMIKAEYGEKEAKRVYSEIVDIVDKELFKEDNNE